MPRYTQDFKEAMGDLLTRSPESGAALLLVPITLVAIGVYLTSEYPVPMAVVWGLALVVGVAAWAQRRRQRKRFDAIADDPSGPGGSAAED